MTIRSDIGPYVIVPEWVFKDVHNDNALRLYIYLGLRCWGKDGWAISVKVLAADTGLSESAVHRAVKQLRVLGALDVFSTMQPSGEQGWNRFVVRTTKRRSTRSCRAQGVTHDTPQGVTHDTPPVSPVTPIRRSNKQIQVNNPPTPLRGGEKLKGRAVCACCGVAGVKGEDVARFSYGAGKKVIYLHPDCQPPQEKGRHPLSKFTNRDEIR